MSIDPISNMLSSLKNAAAVHKEAIEITHSNTLESIAKILENLGYLSEVKRFKKSGDTYKSLHLGISYNDQGKALFTRLRRVSKPGQRIYKGWEQLEHHHSGTLVVSTSKGMMGHRRAVKERIGGEVLLEVKRTGIRSS